MINKQKHEDLGERRTCPPRIDKACDEVQDCIKDIRENGGKFKALRIKAISLIQESLEELRATY